jgi:hypothetical protein
MANKGESQHARDGRAMKEALALVANSTIWVSREEGAMPKSTACHPTTA